MAKISAGWVFARGVFLPAPGCGAVTCLLILPKPSSRRFAPLGPPNGPQTHKSTLIRSASSTKRESCWVSACFSRTTQTELYALYCYRSEKRIGDMEKKIEPIPSMDEKSYLYELQCLNERKNFVTMSHFLDKVPFPKTTNNDDLARYKSYRDIVQSLRTKHLREVSTKKDIRNIALTYSRIYVRDVAKKLGVPQNDAVYLIIKAIKEETINGTLVYDGAKDEYYLQTSEAENLYETGEPQIAFDARIRTCLDLYIAAVKRIL
ncbi:PCI domain-containing protein [Ditylenchus destructor]|nr:PCI domain-containing protein [Ditylenchus destructor]